MSTILFIRHGKAAAGENDFDRPLNEQGQIGAATLKTELAGFGLDSVDLVLHSTARRARETAVLLFPGHRLSADAFLYDANNDWEMPAAYASLGGAPPSAWANTFPRLWSVCEENAAVTHALIEVAAGWAHRIAVIGHAPLLNAVATKCVQDEALKTLILDYSMPECGLIAIHRGRTVCLYQP